MSIAIFSPKIPSLSPSPSHYFQGKAHLSYRSYPFVGPTKKHHVPFLVSADNGSGVTAPVADEAPLESADETVGSNGFPPVVAVEEVAVAAKAGVNGFQDSRWVEGTWDLKQFAKDGKTDWDAVIDAEVKRRKWMQDTPQSSSNDEPVVFDTSIVPWWVWVKRFHLPEAELLNGRAAMVGFFMAYFVDSLTGVGLVDQMGNFFCKTLLFVAVAGVLLIRKNEDIETLKKLLEETTFYDKQWQATWQDEKSSSSGKN